MTLGIICSLSGLLLAALFPNFGYSGLAFFALLPFFYLLENAPGKSRFFLPFSTLVIFFLILLYWIPRVMVAFGGLHWALSVPLYLVLCLCLALYYSPAILCFIFAGAIRPWYAYLLFPFAWVSCDLVRNFWMINGFPWGSLGYTQVDYLWAQIADIGGVYLLTFLVVAVNSALAYACLRRSRLLPLIIVLSMLTLSALYGWQKQKADYLPSNLPVGVVQPVIDVNSSQSQLSQEYLIEIPSLIGALARQGARLIVLPEAPVAFDYYRDRPFSLLLERLASNHKMALIFSNTTLSDSGGYYNSMILLRPDGLPGGRYDKIHLVPFGEYVPAARWLSFVRPLVKEVSSFSAGDEILVTDLGGVRVGGFICYEAIFPELVRRFVAEGAELLVNITDDGWYGKSAAAAQHFQMARLRAVETRRFLVRAANSGISAVVDPAGRVKQQLGLFQRGDIIAGVRPRQELTFYVRYGNQFAEFCIFALLAGLLAGRIYKAANKRG
ncbi:MAG TPA: apolipoprotein N-acyltransferase [Acidobacteriota bacterium]